MTGLDLSQHSESAYALGGPPLGARVVPASHGAHDSVRLTATLREASP